VRDEFGTPRRTEIVDAGADMDDEDLIQREDMVVTVTHAGYIKRVPLSIYRAQRRGGKGRSGMSTKDEDFVTRLFVANTHTPVLFFSSRGIVYKEKVWRLPIGAAVARQGADQHPAAGAGRAHHHDHAAAGGRGSSWGDLDVMFATTRGTVRRNKLSDFVDVRRNGKIAMKLEEEGDEISASRPAPSNDDVLLTAARGQCIRFARRRRARVPEPQLVGVRGISLADGDRVISMAILEHVDAARPSAPPI
jgi:DNA gyrase subunit A